MNYYYCSDGERVSQATIERKRSQAYRDKYSDMPHPFCACGKPAEGSSHILSQKHCKEIHKTELIWSEENFYPACHSCNSRWESNDFTVPNYEILMMKLSEIDAKSYEKRINLIKGPISSVEEGFGIVAPITTVTGGYTPFDFIELTEEETKAAILEAKKKKYFHEKNKPHWEEQEKIKPK